jgi:hypothetical protein
MGRTKRKLLVVGAGAIVITALEGIACGNPVAPRCPGPRCPTVDAAIDAPSDAVPSDAGIDALVTAKP